MKKALKVEEQIAKLKERGMQFDNEDKAKEILLDIGYYRLGFYSFAFEETFPRLKNRNHILNEGTMFSDVVELYYFDSDLRQILTYFLNRIEINVRTQITYIISNYYPQSPTWFVNPLIMSQEYIDNFDKEIYNALKKNPILERHHSKYINDKYAPAWKTLEFMTLGNILNLYISLRDKQLQQAIANHYSCSYGVFYNYMETIRILRNRCAHGSYLYNMKLHDGIKMKPANINSGNRHNVAGAIGVVRYMLKQVSSNRLEDLDNQLRELLNKPYSPKTVQVIKNCTGLY